MSRGEGDGETFLGRWSRLKQKGGEPEPEVAPEVVQPPVAVEEDRTDDEILAELDLPHPDDLKPGDDISGFMAEAVPAKLRRMALRQLWRMNPVLANVDGLVEYGEDYTDSAMVVENLQTVYQVGKGMFVEPDEPEEDEVQAEADADPDGAEAADADSDTQEPEDDSSDEALTEASPASSEAPEMAEHVPLGENDLPLDVQPTKRRMRF